MTSQPGEYCMRCGAKSDISDNEDGSQSYVCPRGHGVQGTVQAAEPPVVDKVTAEEEAEEEPAPRTARAAKPPPYKPPARAAAAPHKKPNKGTGKKK